MSGRGGKMPTTDECPTRMAIEFYEDRNGALSLIYWRDNAEEQALLWSESRISLVLGQGASGRSGVYTAPARHYGGREMKTIDEIRATIEYTTRMDTDADENFAESAEET